MTPRSGGGREAPAAALSLSIALPAQRGIRHTVFPPYGTQSLDEDTRGFPDVESP